MYKEAIEKIKKEFEQVDLDLQNTAFLSDRKKLNELSKKRVRLSKVIDVAKDYEKLVEDMNDYKEMLHESDDELRESIEDELNELKEKLPKAENDIKMALVPPDPNDEKDAIVEIRAGAGGDEAAIFAGNLYRMYTRFAERHGFKIYLMSMQPSEMGGFKEISFLFSGGEAPYGTIKYESGVHRVQRIPATESQGRVHTSAASVVVIPEAEDVDVEVNNNDLKIDTYRASGAGGQHVNKTDSAVRITHMPTGVVVACQEERSQIQNKARAMKVLKSKLFELEQEKQTKAEADKRKSIIKSGDRSDKIRTYNFPQNRMTDHRINLTIYNLEAIMDGDIINILEALKTADYEEFLQQL